MRLLNCTPQLSLVTCMLFENIQVLAYKYISPTYRLIFLYIQYKWQINYVYIIGYRLLYHPRQESPMLDYCAKSGNYRDLTNGKS